MKKLLILAITLCSSLFTVDAADKKDLVDYVNPLVGSQSKISLSTGNTYPAIAMPWGMNFWMPQTGKMGDGWAYTYDADKIRGFKQTHQPSPWINDYGQFAIMPVTGKVVFNQDKRASWFSHKAEVAKPNYYRVLHFPRIGQLVCDCRCFRPWFLCQDHTRRKQDHWLYDS